MGPPPSNARIAAALAEIGDLLAIKGESSFKVSAYRRAAESVARCPVEVGAAFRAGDPPELDGVGSTLSERIGEIASSGRSSYLDALREEVPATLPSLLAVPGVGPRTAGDVWRELGIATLPELETAAREGRLRSIRGISAATEARILEGIGELERRPPRRMLMGEARQLAAHVVALLETFPAVRSATIAGSVRRGRETVGDLDVLVETDDPASVIEALLASDAVEGALSPGAAAERVRASVQLHDGPQLDLMTMPPGAAGSYLVHFTGSAEHNVRLRQRAKELGRTLSEHGLSPLDGTDEVAPTTYPTEADLYAALGLAQIPAELREDRGEIEAAAEGRLPELVTRSDLSGDCHSHSHWSDGREPLEVMVESARRLGHRFLVLTDHSHSLTIANGLDPARVEQQRRVVGELNERFAREQAAGEAPAGSHPDGFVLLHGTELEITADGRLDFDDELLARFDVVLASLHVGRRQPREQLMARYEVALRSPHVDIITHPSGRKIGRRPDLDLDWEGFYRLAAESGTLLEINGSENRLDLDEDRIRAASEAGCRFTIDSDAHDRTEWRNLDWGVTIARRAWLECAQVVNTLPLDEFLALLDDKR